VFPPALQLLPFLTFFFKHGRLYIVRQGNLYRSQRDRHMVTLLFHRYRMRRLKGDTAGATTTDVAACRLPGRGELA
jgi:hypothetical protein